MLLFREHVTNIQHLNSYFFAPILASPLSPLTRAHFQNNAHNRHLHRRRRCPSIAAARCLKNAPTPLTLFGPDGRSKPNAFALLAYFCFLGGLLTLRRRYYSTDYFYAFTKQELFTYA